MTRRVAAVFLVPVLLAGCAHLRGEEEPSEEDQLEQALTELSQGRYAPATSRLGALAARAPESEEGMRALLVLTAAELDARNPERDLNAAATHAARLVAAPEEAPEWLYPVGETLYLTAVELGGVPDSAVVAAGPAPGLPVPTVPERVAGARGALQARVDSLEQRLAERGKELARVREELERIRRTIRP